MLALIAGAAALSTFLVGIVAIYDVIETTYTALRAEKRNHNEQ